MPPAVFFSGHAGGYKKNSRRQRRRLPIFIKFSYLVELRHWDGEIERAALTWLALRPDMPVMRLHQVAGDG